MRNKEQISLQKFTNNNDDSGSGSNNVPLCKKKYLKRNFNNTQPEQTIGKSQIIGCDKKENKDLFSMTKEVDCIQQPGEGKNDEKELLTTEQKDENGKDERLAKMPEEIERTLERMEFVKENKEAVALLEEKEGTISENLQKLEGSTLLESNNDNISHNVTDTVNYVIGDINHNTLDHSNDNINTFSVFQNQFQNQVNKKVDCPLDEGWIYIKNISEDESGDDMMSYEGEYSIYFIFSYISVLNS
ncbi:988_t:CDS:2 [Entrophospora sp. SA101]|nr:4829_t:CDS:2 [Entrophospora sp. SA101]CAJ0836711.1 988_t:CDS:2 [Entrophospora sp. SA101]CAJ0914635.1 14371_t:CDS:2 [Entrophospora sp. SA101]